MPTNFVDLNRAAELLGVTPDTLVEMRSQGEIFGFRDGSSWKFKMDELERVAQERGISLGGATAEPEADLSPESDLDLSKPLFGDSADELLTSDAGDDDDVDSLLVTDEPTLSDSIGSGSVIDGGSVVDGGSVIDGSSGVEGGSVIEGGNPESDLELSFDDEGDVHGESSLSGIGGEGSSILGNMDLASADKGGSDVRLAPNDDGSDVNVVPDSDEGDLLSDNELSDLELSPSEDDGLSLSKDTGTGDLDLESSADSSGGDMELDLSPSDDLELSAGSGTGDLELSSGSGTGELDLTMDSSGLDDDDLVLGGDSSSLGSDVTLGGGDTGINLTSASDSGLSLEEDPIDLGGPVSSLELPDEDVIGMEGDADPDQATQLKQDEAFLLSPDGEGVEDDDSASQVIALDNSEQFDENAATMLGDDAFGGAGLEAQLQPSDQSAGDMLGGAAGQLSPMEDAAQPAGFEAAAVGATAPMVEAPREAPYTIFNVLSLMLITGVLALSGMLMMDVVRNMWSWNAGGPTPSTSIMEGLLSALGIR